MIRLITNSRILITPHSFLSTKKMDPEKPKKQSKQGQNKKQQQQPKAQPQQFNFASNYYKDNGFQFYDIAANLTDHQFTGDYYGKKHHEDDRHQVIERARGIGCNHLLIAAGNLEDAHFSHQMCQQYQNCYATIGVHPCRAKEPFNQQKYANVDQYFQEIEKTIQKMQHPQNKMNTHLVAIGQCGLDYDRLQWSSKEEQLQIFPRHFDLAHKYKLPLYLHNRNTGNDFFEIVEKNRHMFSDGVVHSFTGTKEELQKILALDLFVGINGCSLKTQENLDVLKLVPLQRMMIETDSPYCQIRNSHASSGFVKTKFGGKAKEKKGLHELVKGRNQPCKIVEVLEVISALLERDPKQIADIVFKNSLKILGPRDTVTQKIENLQKEGDNDKKQE